MNHRPIGYYMHHHGAGHLARARAIVAASDWPVTLLGTGIGDAGIDLCDDRPVSGQFDGVDGADSRSSVLHYAPVDHKGVRRRVAQMALWIATEHPALMVVDVSVEVAMLARLASVPTVYVRLNGDRRDSAHLDAFRSAFALLAPFHADLEMASTPPWVRQKTTYFPGIAAQAQAQAQEDPRDENRVLVVVGRGGPMGDGAQIADAARTCPDMHWRVIGPVTSPHDPPPNLEIAGWVDTPEQEIARAGVVIGAAGDGLLGAVLAADRPFICIPQDRPYDEQRATAARLKALDAAIVLQDWPHADLWPILIGEAHAVPSANRRRLHDPDGAKAAALWLADCAESIAGEVEYRE